MRISDTTTLSAALATVFRIAPKCGRCALHVATKASPDSLRCDRSICNEKIVCDHCPCSDDARSAFFPACACCHNPARRVADIDGFVELDDVDVLRAANAMFEAKDSLPPR